MPDDPARVSTFRVLTAASGARATLCNVGASLAAVEVPDRHGALGHVVLGLPVPGGYLGAHPFLGSTVGRYANRIAGARFVLDGREVRVVPNDGPHHLHGGPEGFHRRVFAWDSGGAGDAAAAGLIDRSTEGTSDRAAAVLRYRSADGEQGYPGALDVAVRYTLHATGVATALDIELRAVADAPTVVNLANHAYFNLRDGGASDVLDHVLRVPSARAYELDDAGIPTGRVVSVAHTPLDFRAPHALGERIGDGFVARRGGYDHCYAIVGERGADGLTLAASVAEPRSGRTLEVWTTAPALQLYTGNGLDGSLAGHGGARYRRHAGLCLEAQHPPDAPNQPHFPGTRLAPGDVYLQRTRYSFATAR